MKDKIYFEHLTDHLPELKARFNSFVVTAFDDSMTVEMQLRVLIKWIKKNIELTNDMVDYLNDFIKTFDENLYKTVDMILNKWLEDGVISEILIDFITNNVLKDIKSKPFNIIVWEDKLDNKEDWTPIIQEALDTFKNVYIPRKETPYKVFGTVIPPTKSSLNIDSNVEILKPKESDNDDPIFFLNNSNSTILGNSMYNSVIYSERNSPHGVVSIGYENMCIDLGKNILYCTLRNVTVSGKSKGGNQTGNPDHVIYMANPQVNNGASYFHLLENLYLKNGNTGLNMIGWANANIINNIQFYAVGNEKWLDGAAIKMSRFDNKAPLDNVISNVFHHQSVNATTLKFVDGVSYNTMTNINAEQGGVKGQFIEENGKSSDNIISGIDNVAGGSKVSEGFFTRNNYQTRSSIHVNYLYANNFKTKNLESDFIKSNEKVTNINGELSYHNIKSGLLENTEVELYRVKIKSYLNSTCLFDLTLLSKGSTAKALMKHDHIKVGCYINGSGVMEITNILPETENTVIKTKQDGDYLVFYYHTGNNGTQVKNIVANYYMYVYGVPDTVTVEV